MTLISTIFGAIFITNLLLYKLDGMTFYSQKEKIEQVVLRGLKIAFVTLITVLLIYPIHYYLLKDNNLDYLVPIFVIIGVYSINYLIDIFLKKTNIKAVENYKVDHFVFLNSVAFTAAIVGVLETNLIVSIGLALGLTLGHLLLMVLILSITPKVSLPTIPKSFRGIPAVLIMMGFIAMAFMGLAGLL